MNRISDQYLSTEIRKNPFTCIRCGACCREIEQQSNLVLVSPAEVKVIMAATSLTFDEIAEPYPDFIQEGERMYTLGWAIRREGDRCRFLGEYGCLIYQSRPWICRTYPFMIDNENLIVSPCNGIGIDKDAMDPVTVNRLVHDLIDRQQAEKAEEERIAEVLTREQIPAGKLVVIDGEGMRIMNG
ncbi:MAG TPA: YkgJ family cysteine cluster protein [Methanospirillum sp.]|uniref:YkgJ family cysteine cluster protein n=1 Tax=Methanospirillum sp. TaxID=45200 RepID=UPI002C340958|nr:YkgJ family cysteine cluster protein [Methanospirillum sp.]HWQ65059.1 YkgJ family cysteine cluster protein [Methanospirillum sp.]